MIVIAENWSESYIGQLRKAVGHRKLIVPSVRAIIQNNAGDVLFIQRRGDGSWALPAGGMELDESIFQCLQREVQEETGLVVYEATVISIYTEPRFSVTNAYGDEYQGFEFLYRVDQWSGTIEPVTNETTGAQFFPLNQLPATAPGYWSEHQREVFEDFQRYQGMTWIK